jgi:DNA-binding beta-propeller fold protein YncE
MNERITRVAQRDNRSGPDEQRARPGARISSGENRRLCHNFRLLERFPQAHRKRFVPASSAGILAGLLAAALMLVPVFSAQRPVPPKPGAAARSEPGELLPTGVWITPVAAPGATFGPLNPGLAAFPSFTAGQAVSTALSPDGKTLLILTSGYNRNYDSAGRQAPSGSNEYVFLYDVSANPPRKLQVLQVPDTFDGIAWNPDGREFYVSGGVDDDVHVFARSGDAWQESSPPIRLGHKAGLGIQVRPMAAGLAVDAAGKRLVVANFENDSVSVIDLEKRKKVAELDLRPGKSNPHRRGVPGGEFPFWVVIQGNDTAYVSSPRDRQIVLVNLSSPPRVVGRIALPGQPNKMILDRAQDRLFAALGSNDTVAVVSTESNRVLEEIATTAPRALFPDPRGWKGSNPTSLALSPDQRTLYVTNGGANSVAVVALGQPGNPRAAAPESETVGLIPTGWYPNSVSVSGDGRTLYVVNGKSDTGPNPGACNSPQSLRVTNGLSPANSGTGPNRRARNSRRRSPEFAAPCKGANEYILQLTQAGFLVLPAPDSAELARLTAQVARNDHYRPDPRRAGDERMMAFLRRNIRHVIYIIKENRTYDQVLGDLEKGNGDPKLTAFPEPITPNHHQFARQFVDLDNFYASGEVSGDGWNWSTAARAADSVEREIPLEYAHRGFTYDYEGTNRNINVGFATLAERRRANPETPDDPDLLPGTTDVSAPDGPGGEAGAGYLWDAALRRGLSLRNYGFFLDMRRAFVSPTSPTYIPPLRDPYRAHRQVAFAAKAALRPVTDPYFRGFDQKLPDYWRIKEWEREFDGYVKRGNLPALELVKISHDHFGDFGVAIDGVNTVETEIADNDYALGLLVEKVAASPYRDTTLIFVVEDDAQNGPDHVDAHRTLAFIIGPYVRQSAVVSTHDTTVNLLRTMEEVLGIQPMGINDALARPMADVFTTERRPWSYRAIVPEILRRTRLPLPPRRDARSTIPDESGRYARSAHSAAYWAAKTRGFDFTVEDDLDTPRFNRILWRGLMGDLPYPTARNGRDMRENRVALLAHDRDAREQRVSRKHP